MIHGLVTSVDLYLMQIEESFKMYCEKESFWTFAQELLHLKKKKKLHKVQYITWLSFMMCIWMQILIQISKHF